MSDGPLRARVFISCGQSKTSGEAYVASKIRDRLRELGFDPYIAVEEQSLRGLTENVFAQLRKSEYFLFVDFKREKLADSEFHRGSLFSQQELAIASLLNIEFAAFQEKGVVPLDGIMKFLHANTVEFTDRNRLPDTVANIVQRSQWNPSWRNELVLEESPPENYGGAKCFHVRVQNRHRERLALNCSAYLEKVVKRPNKEIEILGEIVELKWAANQWPRANIPARKPRRFDAFFIRYAEPNKVLFQMHTDSVGHGPQIPPEIGEYELSFLVTSDNFPPVQERFILDFRSSLTQTSLRKVVSSADSVIGDNLLTWLPHLTPSDCKEIVCAVNNFGPAKYRSKPLSYNVTASDLGLLDRKQVIDALHQVGKAWGTAAARATADKLKTKP